jgi:anti-sigma B factor antagonist
VDLDVLQNGNTCTIRVKGPLKMGESVDQFDEAVRAAFASDHPFLVLNLEAMPMVDSSGIGAIVDALQRSKKLGGDTKLVNPSPFAIRILKMVHLLSLFSVYEDEAKALVACGI